MPKIVEYAVGEKLWRLEVGGGDEPYVHAKYAFAGDNAGRYTEGVIYLTPEMCRELARVLLEVSK